MLRKSKYDYPLEVLDFRWIFVFNLKLFIHLICKQDGIDMMSEEQRYMMGDLCEQLFQVVQQ